MSYVIFCWLFFPQNQQNGKHLKRMIINVVLVNENKLMRFNFIKIYKLDKVIPYDYDLPICGQS